MFHFCIQSLLTSWFSGIVYFPLGGFKLVMASYDGFSSCGYEPRKLVFSVTKHYFRNVSFGLFLHCLLWYIIQIFPARHKHSFISDSGISPLQVWPWLSRTFPTKPHPQGQWVVQRSKGHATWSPWLVFYISGWIFRILESCQKDPTSIP